MQPLSENQRPHLLTAPMKMSLVLHLPRKMHLCRSSSNVPRLPSFLEMLQNPHVLLTFDKVHNPFACHAKAHLNVQKCSVPVRFLALLIWKCASRHNHVHFFDISTSKSGPSMMLYILTLKCASRHKRVHFFNISTSKSGPTLVCLVHFDFGMCFAPQRSALFQHLNFRKWGVLCTWASRNNGVQFFISHLASWLRTRRFSEPTFDPPEPQIIGKTQCFATFLSFRASASSFF